MPLGESPRAAFDPSLLLCAKSGVRSDSVIETRYLSGRVAGLETTVAIETIAFGGSGIGRLPDSRVCFVPFTLPGERAVVRIVRQKKTFAEAEVVKMTEVSLARTTPRCPVFGKCGGCAYQHVRYEQQLEIKTDQVRELLQKFGGMDAADIRPMLPAPEQWNYRSRIGIHVQDGQVGFYGRKSNRIVPVHSCPIASPAVNEQLQALAIHPPRNNQRITLREKSGFYGFRQVHAGAAEILARVVVEMLGEGGEHLVDAFCGAGFFAKKLREKFRRVTGIEWSIGAVHAARTDTRSGEIYLEGAVESFLPQALATAAASQTALIVDPPAKGLSSEVLETILEYTPATLIYVSCDPATLARDLKKLAARYRLDFLQPVDMFPQTAEIESVVRLKAQS